MELIIQYYQTSESLEYSISQREAVSPPKPLKAQRPGAASKKGERRRKMTSSFHLGIAVGNEKFLQSPQDSKISKKIDCLSDKIKKMEIGMKNSIKALNAKSNSLEKKTSSAYRSLHENEKQRSATINQKIQKLSQKIDISNSSLKRLEETSKNMEHKMNASNERLSRLQATSRDMTHQMNVSIERLAKLQKTFKSTTTNIQETFRSTTTNIQETFRSTTKMILEKIEDLSAVNHPSRKILNARETQIGKKIKKLA